MHRDLRSFPTRPSSDLDNLANAYRANGTLDLALPLLEEALKLSRVTLGPEHPQTLTIMNTLGDAYRIVNSLDLDLPHLPMSLALLKSNLSLDHPDTFTS